MKNHFVKLTTAILILVILILIPFVTYEVLLNTSVGKYNKTIEFYVKKDTNKNILIRDLYKKKLVKNKLVAKIYLAANTKNEIFKSGIYKFRTSMSTKEILNTIINENLSSDYITVTIPEGYTVKQIAQKLKENDVINSTSAFLKICNNEKFSYSFIDKIPQNRESRLEGYLFPATYDFKKGMDMKSIIDTMLKRFNITYKNVILKYTTKDKADDILKMASIVEKEAKLKEEQPIIASVFYNRLKLNIKLQSCATVEYALGKHKSVLSNNDTKVNSTYNTYKYIGLPEGPICSPGEPAIKAALNPDKTDYLYFVLNYQKNDGSHHFTKTYNEFLKYKKMK